MPWGGWVLVGIGVLAVVGAAVVLYVVYAGATLLSALMSGRRGL